MSAARSGALKFNGEASPVVVELREDDDGVHTEMVMTMVCRTEILASCIDKEKRLELAGASAMCRTLMWSGVAEGSGRWGSYQKFQEVKAELVARFGDSRCSGAPGISHRSSCRAAARFRCG
jgi:hypothetical protein